MRQQIKRIKTNHSQETESKPRDCDLTPFCCNGCCFLYAIRYGFHGGTRQSKTHHHQDGSQHHNANHFHDNSRIRNFLSHNITCTYDMRHLVQGRSGIKPHLFRCQVQYACTVHGRIDKHRQSAENNDCRNSHRCFMRLAFHDRLGSQYGSSPTDRATGGCQQSEIFIHFQQTPDQ